MSKARYFTRKCSRELAIVYRNKNDNKFLKDYLLCYVIVLVSSGVLYWIEQKLQRSWCIKTMLYIVPQKHWDHEPGTIEYRQNWLPATAQLSWLFAESIKYNLIHFWLMYMYSTMISDLKCLLRRMNKKDCVSACILLKEKFESKVLLLSALRLLKSRVRKWKLTAVYIAHYTTWSSKPTHSATYSKNPVVYISINRVREKNE